MLRQLNLGTLLSLYNPQFGGCSARNQRGVGGGGAACAGAGNADPSGGGAAAVPLGTLGFFGRIILWGPRGGGPAGCNSTTTGLGSAFAVLAVKMSPGTRIICTGTVAGWNLGIT